MTLRKKLAFILLLLLAVTNPAKAEIPAAVDPDFKIHAGDLLQITVWKEEGLDRETLVLPDGSISFPLIGSVQAQGQSLQSLKWDLKERLKKFIPDAAVDITVKAPTGHIVSVLGQVAKPGEVMINRQMSVMQALSQAGGLTPYASESGIIIIRRQNGEKKSIPYPYDDISRGRDLDKDIDLVPGDTVFVPTAGLL